MIADFVTAFLGGMWESVVRAKLAAKPAHRKPR
jgi:VanZ family protein